jgi:ABC-type transporter Mla subunit MlaD
MGIGGDPQELQMLIEARARAQQMLDELVRRQAEIEAAAADLSAEQLAEGRAAFRKATESARRVVDNLDQALKLISPVQ